MLYFEDASVGTSVVPGALALRGLTSSTTTAADVDEFRSLLSSQAWDLVIVGEQASGIFGSFGTDLAAYVSGGGRVLGTTWVSDSGMITLLQGGPATPIGGETSWVTTEPHPIFSGLGSTFALTNPGWGTYALAHTAASGATALGQVDGRGAAVIIGNGGRTVLQAPLFDSFGNLAEGQLFVSNEIDYLLDGSAVPEPGTFVMLGAGIAGLWFVRRRK